MRKVVHVFTVPDSLVFLSGQVAFMRERGYEIAVVTSPGPRLDAFAGSEGVQGYGVAMSRRMSPKLDAISLGHLTRVLRRIRPDIVHAHTPKGGLLGMMAATLARVPARIYHMRGSLIVTATGNNRRILAAAERTTCTLAHRVLAVSGSLRDYAIAQRVVAAERIQVLGAGSGNGVDCDGRFTRARLSANAPGAFRHAAGVPDDALVVSFIGRLVREKGVVELTNAWRGLRSRHPKAHLLIAGDFEEERDPVPPEARDALQGDERVHFLGFVEDTAVLYAASDVIALPTYREGFPNVLLEAAAMKVPVVATKVLGCVDAVVDGVTGAIVPARDAAALEAALDGYLSDQAMRVRHGEAARARVEASFRPQHIWESLAGVYDELVTGRPHNSGSPSPPRRN